jgi:hypothetical protein
MLKPNTKIGWTEYRQSGTVVADNMLLAMMEDTIITIKNLVSIYGIEKSHFIVRFLFDDYNNLKHICYERGIDVHMIHNLYEYLATDEQTQD